MKVLWFTTNSSCFFKKTNDYNGGGWISSLEEEMRKKFPQINLGICFYNNSEENKESKCIKRNLTYYSLFRPKKSLIYILKQLFSNKEKASKDHEDLAMPQLIEVLNDFRPDIIHVFGSENIYGLITNYTKVPVVLHIQGILSPCLEAFLPPFVSWRDYILCSNLFSLFHNLSEKLAWERNSVTELRICRNVNYYMGRTKWDKNFVELVNPDATYFYCSEILRDVFYQSSIKRTIPIKPVFISVISFQLYKGLDLVLRTAKVLRKFGLNDFEWRVYGNVVYDTAMKIAKVNPSEVNVKLMGVVDAPELQEALINSTAYVHPSYIENSSNAICEAQMCGCTCIATNVGGTSSLICDGTTGFLVPANHSYQLAYLMKYVYDNPQINEQIGNLAAEVAKKRHNKENIVNRVIDIYKEILNR